MKKSFLKLAMLVLSVVAITGFSSCKKDDDSKPIDNGGQTNNGGINYTNNYFMINGGPFTNHKFQFSDTLQLTAFSYNADSTYLMMKQSVTDVAIIQIEGNSTGTYKFSPNTQMALIMQQGNEFYSLMCDSTTDVGSVIVTSFGNVGGVVKGTMSATTIMEQGSTGQLFPVTITGQFELKRTH